MIAGVAAAVLVRGQGSSETPDEQPLLLGQRTKTTGCVIATALPDRACTPGAIFPGVSREQICTRGYARTVRDVPNEVKAEVYVEYGLPPRPSKAGEYEVDHLVSLELGGSNDIANLWPESADPTPGFHEKDRYENYLHEEVCTGALSLVNAQRRIAESWFEGWQDAGRP